MIKGSNHQNNASRKLFSAIIAQVAIASIVSLLARTPKMLVVEAKKVFSNSTLQMVFLIYSFFFNLNFWLSMQPLLDEK